MGPKLDLPEHRLINGPTATNKVNSKKLQAGLNRPGTPKTGQFHCLTSKFRVGGSEQAVTLPLQLRELTQILLKRLRRSPIARNHVLRSFLLSACPHHIDGGRKLL